jgi:hypothetical protein
VELLLSAAAVRDPTQLVKNQLRHGLGQAMEASGLLTTHPRDADMWTLTPRAQAFVSRVVSEAQVLLGHYCSP